MGPPSDKNRLGTRSAGETLSNIERIGVSRWAFQDLYHYVLIQPWSWFFFILLTLYLGANCAFATLYWLQPGAVAEARPGAWSDAFFFSIETMATVGYGVMHPVTLYAHILVVIEIMFGILVVPVATGLSIVKFTRPTARVLFSRIAVITLYDGVPTFIFRLANVRANQILEARMKVTVLRYETSAEGHRMRRLADLSLLRDTTPMFSLSWSVMHRIDATSPLYGLQPADWERENLVVLALMTGLDGTSSAMVTARYAYGPGDIRHGHMFEDIVSVLPDGKAQIDFHRFHNTVEMSGTLVGN